MPATETNFRWDNEEDRKRFSFQVDRWCLHQSIEAVVVSTKSISLILGNGIRITLQSEQFDMLLHVPVAVVSPEKELVQ